MRKETSPKVTVAVVDTRPGARFLRFFYGKSKPHTYDDVECERADWIFDMWLCDQLGFLTTLEDGFQEATITVVYDPQGPYVLRYQPQGKRSIELHDVEKHGWESYIKSIVLREALRLFPQTAFYVMDAGDLRVRVSIDAVGPIQHLDRAVCCS